MPQPTVTDVHVDAILTQVSIQYRNEIYIAERLFPVIPVQKQSDKYFIYDRAAWFSDEAELRAPGTAPARSGFTLSNDTYFANEWALEKLITDEERENADPPLNLDVDATEWVTDKLLLRLEKQVADTVFRTGVWQTDLTLSGTSQWSDYANSDPFGDIRRAKSTIVKDIGREPNVIVMGREVFDKLADHPDVLERVKYTSSQSITAEILARLFEVERVLVGSATMNTAREGATPTMSFVWGKHVLLCWVPPRGSLRQPSAAYIFMWKPRRIERYREERIRSDVIAGSIAFDVKVTAKEAGYFIQNAVA